METALTKQIKARLRSFRPALHSGLRTIRWAEEVQTSTGFADVVRFEDYVTQDNSYCGIPTSDCKIAGKSFPCENCRGCVHKRTRYALGILATCYEVKISVADFKSPNGHNFHGNRNYYVVPAEICEKVMPLAPSDIGIIVHYSDSGRMAIKRECKHYEMKEDMLSLLLYNALKKWVDGRQETNRI